MSIVGTVESLWRYPVKSMRGEEIAEAFFGFAGVYGDRLFAFSDSTNLKGFPYLTGRSQPRMLQCQPRFRFPEKAARPLNLAEAERLGPGVNPVYGNVSELMVDVETPSGEVFAVDEPALIRFLAEGLEEAPEIGLMRSDRALTDCRPISLFSLQTARLLGDTLSMEMDKRRFRANLYADLASGEGYGEDRFVGRSLRIGERVTVTVLERDPRCKLITQDPETGVSTPAILRPVAQEHGGMAGVYCAVLVEGMVRKGDPIELLD